MIILDIEASGVDPNKNSIISIGAIDFSNPIRQFYGECRIWNGAHIQKDALLINGLTKEEITKEDKITESDLVKKFCVWALESIEFTIGGQNPSFDRDFVQAACRRAKINYPFPFRTIDQHTLCFAHMVKSGLTPPSNKGKTTLNSDMIMKYVGLEAEPHPHNALNGAKYACESIHRLLFDSGVMPEFMSQPIPWKKL